MPFHDAVDTSPPWRYTNRAGWLADHHRAALSICVAGRFRNLSRSYVPPSGGVHDLRCRGHLVEHPRSLSRAYVSPRTGCRPIPLGSRVLVRPHGHISHGSTDPTGSLRNPVRNPTLPPRQQRLRRHARLNTRDSTVSLTAP